MKQLIIGNAATKIGNPAINGWECCSKYMLATNTLSGMQQ